MDQYRLLTSEEITQLERNNCVCNNWQKVQVALGFTTDYIRNVEFSGEIKLGTFTEMIELSGGLEKHTGVYNVTIHNCTIGDNVYINNVKRFIANYNINSNVIIDNVDELCVEDESTFGNGVEVKVLNEGGGREVVIYNELSAHTAYIMCMHRYHKDEVSTLRKLIRNYSDNIKDYKGAIANNASIINCGTIANVNVGAHANIAGVKRLRNGSINSSKMAPAYIGDAVVAVDFIASQGSKISEGANIDRCFIGEACEVSKGFTAENSLFFANSQLLQGEACSLFAGPCTVTHHKSTLLIAGYYSFSNAGSGSNQSNHMYKLGPVHQGVVERGCKTGSDSYVMWPAHIGAFSLIMGRHYSNPDTSKFPFSYLMEDKGKSILLPGAAIKSIGLFRDELKWIKRDGRKNDDVLDHVNSAVFTPYSIQKVLQGLAALKALKKDAGDANSCSIGAVSLPVKALDKGIHLYELMVTKYLGDVLLKNNMATEDCIDNKGIAESKWLDLAGLIVPSFAFTELLDDLQSGMIIDIAELNKRYKSWSENYLKFEAIWCRKVFKSYFGFDFFETIIDNKRTFINNWLTAINEISTFWTEDVRKEFSEINKIGYGIDGEQDAKEKDFSEVRGVFNKQQILLEIERRCEEAIKMADHLIAEFD